MLRSTAAANSASICGPSGNQEGRVGHGAPNASPQGTAHTRDGLRRVCADRHLRGSVPGSG
jgi:hypothetical protein